MVQVTLIPLDALDWQDSFLLDESPVIIGRGAAAHVQLDDRFVSRKHCELYELEGKLVVHDLTSKNGTFVNGYAVQEAFVMPEDLLRVGTARFLVSYGDPLAPIVKPPGSLALVGAENGEGF